MKRNMSMKVYRMMVVAGALAAALSVAARAETVGTSVSTQLSNRAEHKLGAIFSVLGDPVPNLLGVNAAYNLTDYMRLTAGFGHTSATLGTAEASLTTIGAGAKFMVPDWSFTPVGGVNLSYAMFSGNTSVANITQSGVIPYFTLGADWQANSGFNVGFGLNVAMNGVGSLPYVNVGWFF